MADAYEDLEPRSVLKTLGKSPTPTHRLTEASAEAARQFRNSQLRGASITDDKTTRLGDVADSEAILVSQCLYKISGEPEKIETIRKWRYQVVKALYEEIREMSPSLDEKDTVESVQKQIDKLQKKLADLQKAADPNSGSAGTATSA